jgi:hypothetical protein
MGLAVRRALLGLAVLAAAPTPAPALDFAPIRLSERIRSAAVIAAGRIEVLDEEEYSLRVERWIAGAPRRDLLRIRRFADWTCAARNRPYAVGERLLAFLEAERKGPFSVVGAGGEGEVLLEGGLARVEFAPVVDWVRGVPEEPFLDAVAAYRALHPADAEPDAAERWNRILSHPNPFVVSTGLDDLGYRGLREREFDRTGLRVAGALFALLEGGAPEDRAALARHPAWHFGPATARALLPRFEALAASGEGGARVAGALAAAALEPADAARHSAFLDALADGSIPLEHRRAAAHRAGWYSWTPIRPAIPLEAVAPAAARGIRAAGDATLLRDILRYLGSTWGGEAAEAFHDPAPFRVRWLARLGFPEGGGEPPAAAPRSFRDPLLPPEEARVEVPEAVPAHERAAVAFVVRSVRRARNAARVGDAAAAERERGLALGGLFGGVEAAARSLGADPRE